MVAAHAGFIRTQASGYYQLTDKTHIRIIIIIHRGNHAVICVRTVHHTLECWFRVGVAVLSIESFMTNVKVTNMKITAGCVGLGAWGLGLGGVLRSWSRS